MAKFNHWQDFHFCTLLKVHHFNEHSSREKRISSNSFPLPHREKPREVVWIIHRAKCAISGSKRNEVIPSPERYQSNLWRSPKHSNALRSLEIPNPVNRFIRAIHRWLQALNPPISPKDPQWSLHASPNYTLQTDRRKTSENSSASSPISSRQNNQNKPNSRNHRETSPWPSRSSIGHPGSH